MRSSKNTQQYGLTQTQSACLISQRFKDFSLFRWISPRYEWVTYTCSIEDVERPARQPAPGDLFLSFPRKKSKLGIIDYNNNNSNSKNNNNILKIWRICWWRYTLNLASFFLEYSNLSLKLNHLLNKENKVNSKGYSLMTSFRSDSSNWY
jgi:hypothetical protein